MCNEASAQLWKRRESHAVTSCPQVPGATSRGREPFKIMAAHPRCI